MAAPSKKKRSRSRTKPHPGSTNHARRDHRSPVAAPKPATLRDWIGAARLRTLPLAVTPILIGTGAALLIERPMHWVIALACLVVSVSLQIGVNYANDYSDGVRGTDAYRVGPARLTGAGKAKPRTVLIVALVYFAIAGLAGLAITIRTEQWWFLAVGGSSFGARRICCRATRGSYRGRRRAAV